MKVDIAGGAYQTFSKNINAQECVNFFTHIDQEGSSSKLSLRGTPGLKVWCDTDEYASIRGMIRMSEAIYAVIGYKVFRVTDSGSDTECTGTLETSHGTVSMAQNGTQVMIVDGENGYIVVDTTITKITDESFFSFPTVVTEQDGYFLVAFKGSGNVQISDLNDGTSWDSTIYVSPSGNPDDAISCISDHRDLFVFGERSIEVYYNSGNDIPFTRKPGAFQEVGIGSIHSPYKLDNTVFFLTDKIQVARFQGYNPTIISTRAIEYQMAQDSDISNAIGIGITIEGNAFYILTTSNNTWAYNAATNFWHKLASYPEPFNNRWRGNCADYLGTKWIVGDYNNGILYELDFDTFTDNSEPIVRRRVTPGIRQEGKDMFHHSLEIFFEAGVGLDAGVQGSDPIAMLRYSDDGGHTWSYELWRSVGKIGVYKQRAMWNRLGASRHRHYEINVSDPVKWVILDANLEVELGIT